MVAKDPVDNPFSGIELRSGGRLSPEAAEEFSDIVDRRLAELSRKKSEDLSPAEQSFIRATAERMIQATVMLLTRGVSINPQAAKHSRKLLEAAANNIEFLAADADLKASLTERIVPTNYEHKHDLANALQPTDLIAMLSEFDDVTGHNVVTMARESVATFSALASDTAGIAITPYIEADLTEIARQFERATLQPADQ